MGRLRTVKKISKVLEEIFDFLRDCNKYIDDNEPWSLAKSEDKKKRLETVLYNLLEFIRISAILLKPFMPEATSKVIEFLNIADEDFTKVLYDKDRTYEISREIDVLFKRIEIKA